MNKDTVNTLASLVVGAVVGAGIMTIAFVSGAPDLEEVRREAKCDLIGGAYIEGHCLTPQMVIQL
tara:strand:+ start:185 stop:379 length:195 start_codon:yes stop_codon:yes gene_type:complete